jgi:hypothetical protein
MEQRGNYGRVTGNKKEGYKIPHIKIRILNLIY